MNDITITILAVCAIIFVIILTICLSIALICLAYQSIKDTLNNKMKNLKLFHVDIFTYMYNRNFYVAALNKEEAIEKAKKYAKLNDYDIKSITEKGAVII